MFFSKKSTPSSSESSTQQSAQKTAAASKKALAKHIADVRRQQEASLARLPANGLFLILYIRDDPPKPNDFHWGFYFHKSTVAGGTKYHIKDVTKTGWITDHATTRGVFKSQFPCVLVQIANVLLAVVDQMDTVMRSKDHEINQIPGVTCRVWLMVILKLLITNGIVRCNDLNALQNECMEIGNQHSASAKKNDQPRPVVQSKLCQL